MKAYKGREYTGGKVFVYYNLHTHLWSVKALDGPHKGLVIGHTSTLVLTGVTTHVSESGRQRVIQEQRKNVHAGLVGSIWRGPVVGPLAVRQRAISYNPYKGPTFYFKHSDRPYTGSHMALLTSTREVLV